MIPAAHAITVTVERATPGGIDVYGDAATGTTTLISVPGCGIAPTSSPDIEDRGRAVTVTGLALYAPHDSGIARYDFVVVADGPYAGRYEVHDDPQHWSSPLTGLAAGDVIPLRRVEG